MIYSDINPDTGTGRIVLKPNNSASWRFNVMLVVVIGIFQLIISSIFLLQGLWLIMPLYGIELLVLFVCLYICAHANLQAEVITFTDDKVVIEQGRRYAEKSWEYYRPWIRLFIKKPRHEHQPPTVLIKAHGKETELGSFLNKDDKDTLVAKLRKVIYQ